MPHSQTDECVRSIGVADILVDETIQPRQGGIDTTRVDALKESGSEAWPPLVVVARDGAYVLIDGHHRLAAAQALGVDAMRCEVHPAPADGDLHALAFGFNKVHGKPLTLADRKAEAARLLRIASDRSDRDLAQQCGLDNKTIAVIRNGLESTEDIPQSESRRGKDGKTRPATQPRAAAQRGTASPIGRAKERAQDSPAGTSDPSFRALQNLVDHVFAYLEDLAADELGGDLAKQVVDHWPEENRPGMVQAMRTLSAQLLEAAARLDRPVSDTRTTQETAK